MLPCVTMRARDAQAELQTTSTKIVLQDGRHTHAVGADCPPPGVKGEAKRAAAKFPVTSCLDMLVEHHLREQGMHVYATLDAAPAASLHPPTHHPTRRSLRVMVSYFEPHAGNTRSLTKFYRFNVQNPLQISHRAVSIDVRGAGGQGGLRVAGWAQHG